MNLDSRAERIHRALTEAKEPMLLVIDDGGRPRLLPARSIVGTYTTAITSAELAEDLRAAMKDGA